ncbi:MAG: hypothetical protein KDJ44_05215 [Rhodoblastus sp.]|nr:hypothetical protein [Rhodoblastus sp.]
MLGLTRQALKFLDPSAGLKGAEDRFDPLLVLTEHPPLQSQIHYAHDRPPRSTPTTIRPKRD